MEQQHYTRAVDDSLGPDTVTKADRCQPITAAATDAMVEAALRSWNLNWDDMKMSDSYSMREAINAALAQMDQRS